MTLQRSFRPLWLYSKGIYEAVIIIPSISQRNDNHSLDLAFLLQGGAVKDLIQTL